MIGGRHLWLATLGLASGLFGGHLPLSAQDDPASIEAALEDVRALLEQVEVGYAVVEFQIELENSVLTVRVVEDTTRGRVEGSGCSIDLAAVEAIDIFTVTTPRIVRNYAELATSDEQAIEQEPRTPSAAIKTYFRHPTRGDAPFMCLIGGFEERASAEAVAERLAFIWQELRS